MSVTTTCDEKIMSAKEHLSAAYKDLLTVMDEDTWGHFDYKEGYVETVSDVARRILECKKQL